MVSYHYRIVNQAGEPLTSVTVDLELIQETLDWMRSGVRADDVILQATVVRWFDMDPE
jgi:hypothetical protein